MAVRHHSCGKRVFKNLKSARIRASELRITTAKPFRSYRCDHCGKYHLTTKSQSQVNRNLEELRKRKIGKIKSSLKQIKNESKNR